MTVVVEENGLRISRLRLGPWQTNAYVLIDLLAKASLVVDAPAEANSIVAELAGSIPKYILLTHNHLDHIGALQELKNKLKVTFACHPLDSAGLSISVDAPLKGGERLRLGNHELIVIHSPGHTRGSLCFLVDNFLISGDTLFPGGPGNTRSSADFKEIVRSIKEKLMVLPDETTVYPGHGEPTTLAKEKAQFAGFSARPHSPDLHGDVTWLSS